VQSVKANKEATRVNANQLQNAHIEPYSGQDEMQEMQSQLQHASQVLCQVSGWAQDVCVKTGILSSKLGEVEQEKAILERHVETLAGENQNLQAAHNEGTRQQEKAEEINDTLKKQIHALKQRIARVPTQIAKATEKALKKNTKSVSSVSMKKRGRITEPFRAAYRKMTDHGVGNEHVDEIIHELAEVLGFHVEDHVSARTVARANGEGYIHAHMQLGCELSNAEGQPIIIIYSGKNLTVYRSRALW
jgi:SMC interacting uncharacterized protein involved in chromosome segregation